MVNHAKPGISAIIPVYNEEKIIASNSLKILKHFEKQGFKDCEILLCDNGSTDKTPEAAKSVSRREKRVKYLRTDYKGIGHGFILGARKAKNNICILYAIDDPFEKSFIPRSIGPITSGEADIVIGSKGHPESKSERPLLRKAFSKAYNLLTNAFFPLGVADTQGSLAFDLKKTRKLIEETVARDAFFETEFIIRARTKGLNVREIPINAKDNRKDSKINPIATGLNLVAQLVALRFRLHGLKNAPR